MNCKRLLLLLLIVTAAACFEQVFAQVAGMVIKGKVTGKDGLALASVSVTVKGKPNEATLSDAEGNFILRVKENSGTLVLSNVGYALKEVAFTSATTNLDVKMEESVSVLNDVVLTGYIKQKKSDSEAIVFFMVFSI